MCIYIDIHTYMHRSIYLYISISRDICMCGDMYLDIYPHLSTYMCRICMYIHIISVHICTETYICIHRPTDEPLLWPSLGASSLSHPVFCFGRQLSGEREDIDFLATS